MSDVTAPRPEQVRRIKQAAREAVIALARHRGDTSAPEARRAYSAFRAAIRNATNAELGQAAEEMSAPHE